MRPVIDTLKKDGVNCWRCAVPDTTTSTSRALSASSMWCVCLPIRRMPSQNMRWRCCWTLVRRIQHAYVRTREFNFSLNGLTGFDLHGKTVGVIGTGKIGRIFIDICKGFGMQVVAYDPFPAKDLDVEYLSVDELCTRSDIISLHCPLTPRRSISSTTGRWR
jgi:phosphoglycerate dehydrogenase-like enzyme